MTVPNLYIIMRDDWIEIDCVCAMSGVQQKYKIFPDGNATVHTIGLCGGARDDVDLGTSSISIYEALSWIADTTVSNLEALDE